MQSKESSSNTFYLYFYATLYSRQLDSHFENEKKSLEQIDSSNDNFHEAKDRRRRRINNLEKEKMADSGKFAGAARDLAASRNERNRQKEM
jgi:hypothetical protein